MTDTNEAVIHEALSVIDKALSQMMSRELVSSGEITDVLLDVRTLLTMPATPPQPPIRPGRRQRRSAVTQAAQQVLERSLQAARATARVRPPRRCRC